MQAPDAWLKKALLVRAGSLWLKPVAASSKTHRAHSPPLLQVPSLECSVLLPAFALLEEGHHTLVVRSTLKPAVALALCLYLSAEQVAVVKVLHGGSK